MNIYEIEIGRNEERTIEAESFNHVGGTAQFFDDAGCMIASFSNVLSVQKLRKPSELSTINTQGKPAATPEGWPCQQAEATTNEGP